MRHAPALLVSFAALASAIPASAATRTYVFPLDPIQSGGGGRTGSGQATVVLDDVTGAISVNGTFTGMSGTRIDQHLHGPAPVGGSAPVFFPLSGTGTNSGTVFGSGILNSTQIGYITSGNTYLNIHSSPVFTGGELRGQVVPEPTGVALLGMGAAAVLRRVRR